MNPAPDDPSGQAPPVLPTPGPAPAPGEHPEGGGHPALGGHPAAGGYPAPAPDAASAVGPRQRLHPLSPLLHSAKALVVIVAALSWQTLSRVGPLWFAAMVAVLLLGTAVLAVVSWYNTGYQVVGRELRIHEGLLWRRTRAIPLERLQAVEVVRPLLAQVTGLAELRLEVVGGAKTEAPLAYLTVGDAVALRERLLALAYRTAPPAAGRPAPGWSGPAPGWPAPPPGWPAPVPGHAAPAGAYPVGRADVTGVGSTGRLIHAVSNRDLLVSQLLTPQAFLLPFGVAFVLTQFVFEGSWSFIAVASTLTAMAGVVLQPVRRVLDDWNFRLARDETALRVRHGLLETRAQTVPLDRVQAITVTWPLLWRAKDWARLRLAVAGYSGVDSDGGGAADRLLPVGSPQVAQAIVDEVLPGVVISAGLTPPPRRARWVHPLARPVLGAGLTDTVFAVRSGLLTRQLVAVPYARIQSVRVVQGPLQRRLGLATVHVDAAGGAGAAAVDRDISEAWVLAAELSDRARAARQRA